MLTSRKRRAIEALLTAPTKKEAAAAAGITARTMREYFADSEFQAEYRKACDALIDDATRQLKQLLPLGMDALEHLLTGETISDATRHAAIRTLLEYTAKYTELNDIEQRLEALERAYHEDHP